MASILKSPLQMTKKVPLHNKAERLFVFERYRLKIHSTTDELADILVVFISARI